MFVGHIEAYRNTGHIETGARKKSGPSPRVLLAPNTTALFPTFSGRMPDNASI